jgi:hypothetical protein
MIILILILPAFLLFTWLMLSTKKLQRRGRRSPINENILRTPGHSIRRIQVSKVMDLAGFMFGVMIVPFLGFTAYKSGSSNFYVIASLTVFITAWFFILAVKVFGVAIRLHQALDAETTTGQELNFLMRDGAWVFHDIPYQYGNIDHVIVGAGGVFAVETKGISKPTDNENSSSENSTVRIDRDELILPHARTGKPIQQAKTHAKWLRNEIQRRFGLKVPVRAVVALPGWMIKHGFDGDCWVVNPKRGNSLRGAVTKELMSEKDAQMISAWIDDLARSVVPKSKDLDPKSEFSQQSP